MLYLESTDQSVLLLHLYATYCIVISIKNTVSNQITRVCHSYNITRHITSHQTNVEMVKDIMLELCIPEFGVHIMKYRMHEVQVKSMLSE